VLRGGNDAGEERLQISAVNPTVGGATSAAGDGTDGINGGIGEDIVRRRSFVGCGEIDCELEQGGGVDRGDDGNTSIAGRPATSIPPAADEELSSPFPTETSAAAGDWLRLSPALPAAAIARTTPRCQPPSRKQTPSRPWRCAAASASQLLPYPSGRLRAPMAR